MKRALLSIGAAVALAAAALPISASAQHSPGVRGGATPGGGISAGARSGMSAGGAIAAPRSGGNFAVSPGGVPRSAVSPSGSPRGGQSFAQGGGNWQGGGRNWQGGNRHHRGHHIRGPGVAFGFAAPYYYDYATPYVYEDDDCWQVRLRRGEYVRVYVCD